MRALSLSPARAMRKLSRSSSSIVENGPKACPPPVAHAKCMATCTSGRGAYGSFIRTPAAGPAPAGYLLSTFLAVIGHVLASLIIMFWLVLFVSSPAGSSNYWSQCPFKHCCLIWQTTLPPFPKAAQLCATLVDDASVVYLRKYFQISVGTKTINKL